MKKARIIRIATLFVMVMISLTMCACNDAGKIDMQNIIDDVANEREGMIYDEYLIEIGKDCLDSFERESGRIYSVNFRNNKYFIDINGESVNVDYVEHSEEEFPGEKKTPKNYDIVKNKKMLEVVNRAKAIVCDYIEKSLILEDKEELKEKIVSIPIVNGEENDTVSAFYTDQKIYINKHCINYFSEWVVVHELVHYLCELTHGGPLQEDYPFTEFVETMTDLITMSMQPEENLEFPSGYFENYQYVLPYVGRFEEEAIRAYFYGHKYIWNEIGRYKFDVFVGMLDNLHGCGDIYLSWVIIENQINEWACQTCG